MNSNPDGMIHLFGPYYWYPSGKRKVWYDSYYYGLNYPEGKGRRLYKYVWRNYLFCVAKKDWYME